MTESRIYTAALVIIGDEILSGRTQDKNISQIALWLNIQGIRLRMTTSPLTRLRRLLV
jgi:molybdopterin-biosynthesis enzyme MoeA-like protein